MDYAKEAREALRIVENSDGPRNLLMLETAKIYALPAIEERLKQLVCSSEGRRKGLPGELSGVPMVGGRRRGIG